MIEMGFVQPGVEPKTSARGPPEQVRRRLRRGRGAPRGHLACVQLACDTRAEAGRASTEASSSSRGPAGSAIVAVRPVRMIPAALSVMVRAAVTVAD